MATWTGNPTVIAADTTEWATRFFGYSATAAQFLTALLTKDGTDWARAENVYANFKLLSEFTESNPGTGTINSIKLQIRCRDTASGSGSFDSIAKIGGTIVTTDTNINPLGSWTEITTSALSRPGGGSWTWADLTNGAEFGLRTNGNGNGGGENRIDAYRLIVDYTEASTPPTADFTVNTTTGTAPLTVDFADLSTESPTSWAWDFGDGGSATASNPSNIYTAAGTYTVTETATNAAGSDSEVKLSFIDVQAATAPVVATFTGNPLTGAFPFLVNFYDGATGTPSPGTWAWDFGDGSTAAVQNPSNIYTAAGTYTVVETVSNTATIDSVSTATRNSYIVVLDGRPQPTINGTPVSGTRPLSVQFTGSANNPATAWGWEFGDGGISNEQNPLYTYADAGTYTVSLSAVNANGVLDTTRGDFITVNWAPPVAAFNLSLSEGPEPLLVRFDNESTGDIQTYSWHFGDGGTSLLMSPSYTYTSAGTYTASLVVSGTAGTSTATATGINVTNVIAGGGNYDFVSELQEQLMSAQGISSPCDAFLEFGGVNNVVRAIYERLVRFVMETGLLQKEAALGASVSTGVYNLPTDLIEIRRVEVDGEPIRRMDQKMADFDAQSWETDTGDFLGYIQEPSVNPLTLTLVPLKDASSSVKVLYVYAPAEWTAPATCTDDWDPFPLPGLFWWPIKYGVYADLLANEGDLYDPARAALCEQLYAEGVELTKLMLEGKHG